jgi:hypothetical protein
MLDTLAKPRASLTSFNPSCGMGSRSEKQAHWLKRSKWRPSNGGMGSPTPKKWQRATSRGPSPAEPFHAITGMSGLSARYLDRASRTRMTRTGPAGMTWRIGTIRTGFRHLIDGWSLLIGLLWLPPAGTGLSRPVGSNDKAKARFTPSDALGSEG